MADPSPSSRSTSVAYALGELKGSVDALEKSQTNLTQTLGPRFAAVETRVTKIEERQWMWMGGGAVLLAIASITFGHAIH